MKTLSDLAFKSFPLSPNKNKPHKPWSIRGLHTSTKNMRCLSYLKKFYDDVFFQGYVKLCRKVYLKK